MSEDNTEKPKAETEGAITDKYVLDDFVRFAQAKKLSMRCPSCEQTSGWKIYANKRGNFVMPKGLKGDIFIGQGVDVIAMRCNNCGYIKQYDLAMFAAWLKTEKSDE